MRTDLVHVGPCQAAATHVAVALAGARPDGATWTQVCFGPSDDQLLEALRKHLWKQGEREEQEGEGVTTPRRVFPELITEEAEPGEEQVYGAVADFGAERLVKTLFHILRVVAASNRQAQLLHCC